jgi:TPR repeat protein
MFGVMAAALLAAAAPDDVAASATPNPTASLEGEWRLRALDPETGRPSRHHSFEILKANKGRLIGTFPDPLYGDFRDGAIQSDSGEATLTFKTARGAVGWLFSGDAAGPELFHEAIFRNGRLDGVTKEEDGAIAFRWQARRADDDGDRGEFLADRTWRLKIVDKPEDFCRETYEFRDDGTMTSRSGEEVLEKSWRVETEKYDSTLITRILSTNGKPDCQGDMNTKVGDERALPIVFFNGGGYAVCAGPDRGLSCYGVVSEVVKAREAKPAQKPKNYNSLVVPVPISDDKLRALRIRQCDEGSGADCHNLSSMFMSGRGGPVDKAQAVEAARKGCDLDHGASCFAYANGLFIGAAGEKDISAALENFDRACGRNHARSCMMSGRIRLSADESAYAQALPYSHRGCDLGDGVACGDEALAVINMSPDRERPERLRAMLKAGCDADAKAGHCGPLGGYYLSGLGGAADIDAARVAYQHGCKAEERLACYGYAEFIARGFEKGMKRKDARQYYEFACEEGVEPACKRAGKRAERK